MAKAQQEKAQTAYAGMRRNVREKAGRRNEGTEGSVP
jgi:hypothetical protein